VIAEVKAAAAGVDPGGRFVSQALLLAGCTGKSASHQFTNTS
jgi:hypothetical protein